MPKLKANPHPGPAPTGTAILLRIPEERVDEIDQLAKAAGLSRAAQIRLMLDDWIKEKTEPA